MRFRKARQVRVSKKRRVRCRPVNPLRHLFLAASQNAWLRHQATRRRFVRRAVARFMPGESADEALAAATALAGEGFGTLLTHLGENVGNAAEVGEEVRH